jgi:hypothetical protein
LSRSTSPEIILAVFDREDQGMKANFRAALADARNHGEAPFPAADMR